MGKTKIEWANHTWNPVWGCNAGCDYCYARGIAKRFAQPTAEKNMIYGTEIEARGIAEDLRAFKPTFLYNQFKNFSPPKKPSRIFVGSMSDIFFWEDEWIEAVAERIERYPQHTFLFLTKYPKAYERLDRIMPYNAWFGVTVTKTIELEKMIGLLHAVENPIKRKFFTSFEPLVEYIPTKTFFGAGLTDWVIIGSMSGKNEPRTKTEWIGAIVEKAKEYNKPVFVKQIEVGGKIEKDIAKFPKELQTREFPSMIEGGE